MHGCHLPFPLAFGAGGLLLVGPGLIVAIADDGLPPDDADEHSPVVHHRDEVLVHGGFHQLVHAGGNGHSLVIPLVGEGRDVHILRSLNGQPVEPFQPPEDIPLCQGAQ